MIIFNGTTNLKPLHKLNASDTVTTHAQNTHTQHFNGHFSGKTGQPVVPLILSLQSSLSITSSQDKPQFFVLTEYFRLYVPC